MLRFFALAFLAAALMPRLSADPVFPRLASEPGVKPEDTDQWQPIPPSCRSSCRSTAIPSPSATFGFAN